MQTAPEESRLGEKVLLVLIYPFLFLFWCMIRVWPVLVFAFSALLPIGGLAFFGLWPQLWPVALALAPIVSWAVVVLFKRMRDRVHPLPEAVVFLWGWGIHVLITRGAEALLEKPERSDNVKALVLGTGFALAMFVAREHLFQVPEDEEDGPADWKDLERDQAPGRKYWFAPWGVKTSRS